MPHTRRPDQTVEAFSLPRSLLTEALQRAAALRMTKSGYFRYCLALELGYSESEAMDLAQHGAVSNTLKSIQSRAGSIERQSNPKGVSSSVREDIERARRSGQGIEDSLVERRSLEQVPARRARRDRRRGASEPSASG